MKVLSPYGKDVLAELKDIYGFDSVESATKFVIRHLQQQYQFRAIEVETLHVAYGLVAKLKADGEIYHLKFASRSMHDSPDQLFPWLDYARKRGVLVPEVISAINGNWYSSPLENIDSDYDIVYLMRDVPGKPMKQANESLLQQYAEAMAQFHRVGFEYPHSVLGIDETGVDETWRDKWSDCHVLSSELKDSPLISQELLSEAMQLIKKTEVCKLTQTILHGDFRFCHVFFEDNILSGLIDVDESTQGERLIELCYGLVSGSSPEGGSFLTFEQLRSTLAMYHQCLPLSEAEQSILKGAFAWAFLETLCGLSEIKATKEDIDKTQTILRAVLKASTEDLLCAG
ncbi:MAG: phosphotransferase [Pleurocapsa sp. MO_226.B13]|nr:phosphotransferase [Pleurocapsa sp. MO_226.B13]